MDRQADGKTLSELWYACIHACCASVCVFDRPGLVGKFNIGTGRASSYRLNIMQRNRSDVRVGVYDYHKERLILFKKQRYTWANNSTETPDDRPLCPAGNSVCLGACKLCVDSIQVLLMCAQFRRRFPRRSGFVYA